MAKAISSASRTPETTWNSCRRPCAEKVSARQSHGVGHDRNRDERPPSSARKTMNRWSATHTQAWRALAPRPRRARSHGLAHVSKDTGQPRWRTRPSTIYRLPAAAFRVATRARPAGVARSGRREHPTRRRRCRQAGPAGTVRCCCTRSMRPIPWCAVDNAARPRIPRERREACRVRPSGSCDGKRHWGQPARHRLKRQTVPSTGPNASTSARAS